MINIFITSTIHSDWNIFFNPQLCQALEGKGFRCYLPQRDTNQDGLAEEKFYQNINGIRDADKVLCVAENESANLGGEVGFAYGLGKNIIVLKSKGHDIPLMLRFMVTEVVEVENLNDIETYLDKLYAICRNHKKSC